VSSIDPFTPPAVRRLVAVLVVAATAAVATVAAPGAAQAQNTPDGFADLADRLLPSVVNISTTQTIANRGPEMPEFPPGSPFEEFFREFFDRHGGQAPTPRRATSLGSGFVIDADGLVVTNNHVVREAEEISVILHDDTVLEAEVIGTDAKTDLALLRVKSDRPLDAVRFGDSDRARVGEWVMAIGNPFGLGGTVTSGIISAKTRDINAGPYDEFIQTDAAINRGNSGGPLFNMNGEVIGINTAIFSPTGGSVGIGFAVPSNLAEKVIADLMEYGRTRRGWLGVRIQTVTDEIAESLGLDTAAGALVASVEDGGPADSAGIRPGDVILSFAGTDVEEMRRLPGIVADTEIGASVPVQVWRDGDRRELRVEVGELNEEQVAAFEEGLDGGATSAEPGQSEVGRLGLAVAPLTDEARTRFDLPDDAEGVVVTEVERGSAAAEKGIMPGNVIIEVNQNPVGDPADVMAQIEQAREKGRKSVLLLVRGPEGDMRFVAVRLTETG